MTISIMLAFGALNAAMPCNNSGTSRPANASPTITRYAPNDGGNVAANTTANTVNNDAKGAGGGPDGMTFTAN